MLQYLQRKAVKILALTVVPLLTFTPIVYAQSGRIVPAAANKNKVCICDPKDPFDPRARMPQGPFKGRCMSCKQRSVRLLSPVETIPYNAAPDMLVIANFNYKGKYWVAKIPKNAVEDVIFQIQYYNVLPSPYTAHSQIRFRLKPGYEAILVPQSIGVAPTEIRMRDFVYAANAMLVEGGEWNPATGLLDFFAIAHEFISLEDRIKDAFEYKLTDRVEQIRLALTPQQKQELLMSAILQGDRDRTNSMYDTLNKNCTSEVLRAVDRTIGYNPKLAQKGKPEVFISMPTGPAVDEALFKGNLTPDKLNKIVIERLAQLSKIPIPTPPYEAIVRRKLVNSKSKIANLEVEFSREFNSSRP
jgi:hypothetical protein